MSEDRAVRTPLGGGVSSDVAIVRDESGREIVVKQALPRFKVAADWRVDPARSSLEVQALREARALLGAHVAPEVLWEDADHHCFAMQRIDSRLRNWRDELDARVIDLKTAARVGELLAMLHVRSAAKPELAARFGDLDLFKQQRIEPFFNRIVQRNPGLRAGVGEAIAILCAPGRSLVHGDYSPKNMLVHGTEVVLLDWEVAHWGEPRFDAAFCLMHLILDAHHRPPADEYVDAALTFIEAYARAGGPAPMDAVLVRITGCLLLARLEGDSPIHYLHELDASVVKRQAVRLIEHPPQDAHRMLDQLFPR